MKNPRVVITVAQGLIQAVYSDAPVEVVILDEDTVGDNIIHVNGLPWEAVNYAVDRDSSFVHKVFTAIKEVTQ